MDISEFGKMLSEQRETVTIATKNDLVSFVEETLYERDTTAGVAKSPVQRRDEKLHMSRKSKEKSRKIKDIKH
jgi:hypothetical protein